jgi:hypothetical protein
MTKYLANDFASIEAFVGEIDRLNDKQLRWFLAGLVNAGLINLDFDNKEEFTKLSEFAVAVGTMPSEEDCAIAAMNFQDDETIAELTEETILHIESGKDDAPNSDAIGGWNQNELTLATGILEYAQTV